MQTFYNCITQAMRSMIDTAMGDMLMNKSNNEAYNVIEEMAINNYKGSMSVANLRWLEVSLMLMPLLHLPQ